MCAEKNGAPVAFVCWSRSPVSFKEHRDDCKLKQNEHVKRKLRWFVLVDGVMWNRKLNRTFALTFANLVEQKDETNT